MLYICYIFNGQGCLLEIRIEVSKEEEIYVNLIKNFVNFYIKFKLEIYY